MVPALFRNMNAPAIIVAESQSMTFLTTTKRKKTITPRCLDIAREETKKNGAQFR